MMRPLSCFYDVTRGRGPAMEPREECGEEEAVMTYYEVMTEMIDEQTQYARIFAGMGASLLRDSEKLAHRRAVVLRAARDAMPLDLAAEEVE